MDSKDVIDCTFLVNSYDGGEDLWENFFKLLKINWPEMNYPILLNTESKNYDFNGYNVRTLNLYPKTRKITWAKRLKDTLTKIDTEFVIFMLDDFWIGERVNNDFVEYCIDIMRSNKDITNICLLNTSGENIDDRKYKHLLLKAQKSAYRFSSQAGIWRTRELQGYLRPHESAWDWELFGNYRSFKIKKSFYCVNKQFDPPLKYNVERGGVVHRGKWNKDYIDKLKKRYGIIVDYSVRGIDSEDIWTKERKKSTIIEKFTKPNFWLRLKSAIKLMLHKFLSTFPL